MPFVSLIIPVYNAEKYLRRCLNSAMEQTFQDMEIIVVNDGSQDTSLKICREYAKMDRRFRVINKENTGVSDSRNQAIETARGEYLQFMDSDDWLTPDAKLCSCRQKIRLRSGRLRLLPGGRGCIHGKAAHTGTGASDQGPVRGIYDGGAC